jgi:hypothetical protein
VSKIEADLVQELESRRDAGERVAGYGAAAKATVLLNACGIGPELLEYVVDRNPRKQGLTVPGVGIPIEDPSVLLDRKPDALLVLVWNIADEVMAQEHEYRAAGGTFIIPIPEVRSIS